MPNTRVIDSLSILVVHTSVLAVELLKWITLAHVGCMQLQIGRKFMDFSAPIVEMMVKSSNFHEYFWNFDEFSWVHGLTAL